MKRLMLTLLLLTMACEKPARNEHFVGEILELRGYQEGTSSCTAMLFKKTDGSMVQFGLTGWPPAWRGFRGEILLKEAHWACGYTMISAKELEPTDMSLAAPPSTQVLVLPPQEKK